MMTVSKIAGELDLIKVNSIVESCINSLTVIDAHEHQFFDKHLSGLVTSTIFVRC